MEKSPIPLNRPIMASYFFPDSGRAPDRPSLKTRNDLTFFFKGIQKRFPHVPLPEIHETVESILEEMKPSRDRTRLHRSTVHRLKQSTSAS